MAENYRKLFDPTGLQHYPIPDHVRRIGDRTRDPVYVYDEDDRGDIALTVNIALATSRPLLISGDPGTGKTSLAFHVAKVLGWRLYKLAISHRTHARDLLWTFDAVRRLADAQAKDRLKHRVAYVSPGVLWWAFDPDSARRRGFTTELLEQLGVPEAQDPFTAEGSDRAVVLLDEIDKADPDVPNNLLEALGSYRFIVDDVTLEGEEVRDLQTKNPVVIAQQAPLVMLTTNDERELPRAFVRRCVSLTLKPANLARLLKIARAHFPDGSEVLHRKVAQELEQIRSAEQTQPARQRRPGAAEYLDAIGACRELKVLPDTPAWHRHWDQIAEATLRKSRTSNVEP